MVQPNTTHTAWIDVKQINEFGYASGFPNNLSRFPEFRQICDSLCGQKLELGVRIREDLDEQLDAAHQCDGPPYGRMDGYGTEDAERSGLALEVVRLEEVRQDLGRESHCDRPIGLGPFLFQFNGYVNNGYSMVKY